MLLGKSSILALAAVVVMVIGSRVPARLLNMGDWRAPALWLLVFAIGLLMVVHVPTVGHEVNGARRWIKFGDFSFQPSEVAKWTLILALAWHCARHAGSMRSLRSGFLPPMLLILLVCGLIATEDLGTAVLVAMVGVAMLIAAGARIWHAALLIPVCVAGIAAAIVTSPYRIDRLRAFLNPYDDAQGIGYHILQSLSAVNGGGIAGRGLGNSVQKFGYLPEDTTDFIFSIICEEVGIIGPVVVVALYCVLLGCLLAVVRRAVRPFDRLVAIGVMLNIGLQAAMNMMVVTGLAPTKGIALPLVSSGGTGWILTAFFVGLAASIDREAARYDIAEVASSPQQPRVRKLTTRVAPIRPTIQPASS
jgi:cell division protein FtsW